MKKLFKQIVAQRKRHGHGYINLLCAAAGVAPSTLWRCRAGKTTLEPRTLAAIKAALRCLE